MILRAIQFFLSWIKKRDVMRERRRKKICITFVSMKLRTRMRKRVKGKRMWW